MPAKKTMAILASIGILAIGMSPNLAASGAGRRPAVTSFAVVPADLSGTWIGKTVVPNQGMDELTMAIKKLDNGYAGTVVDTLGLIAPETAISNIKLKDDALTCTFPLIDGTIITCRMKIAGDKITGGWEHPEGSSAPLEFDRKK